MDTIHIGGVNEHFNMPWKLLFKSDDLANSGISASWTDYPGGTGAMVEDLNNGNLDIAVLLTEGALKAIHDGGKFKILTFFVTSPLIWGIHVSSKSSFNSINELKGKKYAISRFGSGSHIMSFVNARRQNWPVEELDFALVNDLEGARTALKNQTADVFLWEKYTTHPLVESGEFRRIGEYPTPYDCFVVAVSERAFTSKKEDVLKIVELAFKQASILDSMPDKTAKIAEAYNLPIELVDQWISNTKWARSIQINYEDLILAEKILSDLDLIATELRNDQLIWA